MSRPDPLILGFDTAAAHCAAAVVCGDRLLVQRVEAMDKGQAERLMPLIAETLAAAGVNLRDLAAIGVGTGPGNFTGIRISVAAARGLALALGVPAIGVSGFAALREATSGPLLAAIDARRGTLWLDAPGLAGPVLTGADDLPELLRGCGCDAVGYLAPTLAAFTGGAVKLPRYPVAEAIARHAALRLGTPQPRPAPLYLRAPDAAPATAQIAVLRQ